MARPQSQRLEELSPEELELCLILQAAGNRQRTDALLDSPTLGQQHEAFGEIDALWRALGRIANAITPPECANYIRTADTYSQPENAL